jgi:organic radical activating enzyme
MTPDMWEFDPKFFIKNSIIYEKLVNYYNQGIRAVVISGGEPFDQPCELFILLDYFKKIGFNDILLYSGYEYPWLVETYPNHLKLIDILISGSFCYEQETSSRWYGSDNQKITVLSQSSEYDSDALDTMSKQIKTNIQIETDGNEVFLIGIMQRADFTLIKKQLNE